MYLWAHHGVCVCVCLSVSVCPLLSRLIECHSPLLAGYLLVVLFDPEDGGGKPHRNTTGLHGITSYEILLLISPPWVNCAYRQLLLVICLNYCSNLNMEEVRSSETSMYFCRITRPDIPVNSTLHSHLLKNTLLPVVYLLVLIFYSEDGGSRFLRNVDWFLQDYMASHPTSSTFNKYYDLSFHAGHLLHRVLWR